MNKIFTGKKHTITMNAALRAGPKADSTLTLSWNILGKLSKRVSTTLLESDKFTRRSSGIGRNISSRSATTIIWGCDEEDWNKQNKELMEQLVWIKVLSTNLAWAAAQPAKYLERRQEYEQNLALSDLSEECIAFKL